MGAYLSQPITDKESSDGEDDKFKYGTTAMQGWRTNMEVRPHAPQGTLRHPGLFFYFLSLFPEGSKRRSFSSGKVSSPSSLCFSCRPRGLARYPDAACL